MTIPKLRIGDVAQINPRPSRVPQLDEKVSFAGMTDLNAERGCITQSALRPYAEVCKGYTPFHAQDILVAKITPCFENCKIGEASIPTDVGYGSTEFHVIRPLPARLDRRYLLHFLRQARILKTGERRMTGSAGQRRVPASFLEALEIPLPPLEEQRRVAAILDKASALKQQSLKALAQVESLGIARLEQLLIQNQESLTPRRLEELCATGAPITYGILQPGPDLDLGIFYVRPSEIKNSQIDIKRLKKTSFEIAVKYRKSELKEGDILLTIVGTIGETALVPPELEGGNITQSSARVRIDPSLACPAYIYHFFKSQHALRQISRDRLGVAVERLNLHHVRDIEILCLPMEVQDKFGAEVHSLAQLVSRHSLLAQRTSSLLNSLSNSLLVSGQEP